VSEETLDLSNAESIFCLACGGVVVEHPPPPAGAQTCTCHLEEAPHADAQVADSAKSIRCPACGGSLKLGARACPYCHSAVATKRCGDCLAWNLADARHCQECASTNFDASAKSADPKSPENISMKCPRCLTGSLVSRRYADLRSSECDSCGGILLDVEMMNKVVAARDHSTALRLALPKREAKRETEVHYLMCPVCKKSMNRKQFGRISGVVVDVCRTDGVWFDSGELVQVLAFVERGGLEEERKRELDDLQESKRALEAAKSQAAAYDAAHTPNVGGGSGLGRDIAIGREVLSALASLWS
jgi:Zn-finger nucleic acid-binding protein